MNVLGKERIVQHKILRCEQRYLRFKVLEVRRCKIEEDDFLKLFAVLVDEIDFLEDIFECNTFEGIDYNELKDLSREKIR